jgi:[protein-PII] uridylyltransferase
MLLHDIAKGKRGDHSINGSIVASTVCPRLGLSKDETEIVKWLVLHHLLLSKTAFRYELGDPKTIKDFAEKVKTVEKLKLLLVLTVADIKGVGPEIWNDWKGSLISDLYIKSLNVLQKRISTQNIYEHFETTRELFKSDLLKNGIKKVVVEQYTKNYYKNYWEIFSLQTIINHFYIFNKMVDDKKKFKIHLSKENDSQATELIVIAPDHHGLFSRISGLVAASGYDVVSAKIITRSDGYALDTFFIQNKEKKPISEDYLRKKLIKTISLGLEGNFDIEKALNTKWEEIPARFRAVKAPTRIIVDNKTSENFTILDIKCKNAPGVLYKITKTLTSLGIQINTANVSTYGDRVVDIFYIKNAFGSKVDDTTTIDKIKKSILKILEEINFTE